MPLDTATLVAPQLLKLDPIAWRDRLRAFAQAKRDKKAADAQARALEDVIKSTENELIAALGGAPAAVCGEMVVTAKAVAGFPDSLTLADGRKVPLSTVAAVVIGNVQVPGRDVLKLVGGRSGRTAVDVAGA
jgi:hypothetical protein